MIGDFIIKQILGMKWLNELIGGLLSAIGVDLESSLGGGIHFFLYDVNCGNIVLGKNKKPIVTGIPVYDLPQI